MKRIPFTFLTLIAFGSSAIAAGPVAPRESKENETQQQQTESVPTSPHTPTSPSSSSFPATHSNSTAEREAASAAGKSAAASSPAAISGADQAFLQKAAEMNQYQLEMSKAAARISKSPEIRQAAKTMERDLTTARQQLESLAASKGITLPTSLPQRLQDQLTAAESRTSGQFDESYLENQVEIKQESITFMERDGSRVTDTDIKAWAEQITPSLKSHLSLLKKTRVPAVGEKNPVTPSAPTR